MSAELTKSINALEASGRRFGKRGSVIAVASLGAIGAGQAAAYFLAPGLELTGVHIPVEVLAQFVNYAKDEVPFRSALASLNTVAPIVSQVLLIIAVIAGGIRAITSTEISKAFAPIVAAVMLVVAVYTIASFSGGNIDGGNSGPTAVEKFTAYAERADVDALRAALADANASAAAKDYVLAQATLVAARNKGEAPDSAELARQVRDLDAALQQGTKIDVDPRTVYLLEHHALGGPKSPIAMQHGEQVSHRQIWGNAIGAGTSVVGLGGLMIGLGSLCLAAVIIRRVKRLRGILSPTNAVSA